MPLRKAYLAATALVAAVGFAGLAAAQIEHSHVMNVRLPDGSVEHIRYQGDRAPQVRLEMQPAEFAVLVPTADDFAPFAALERVSAQMDREAALLLQQAEAGPTMSFGGANGPMLVDFGRLPPGASGFSMVSTSTGAGVCTRSVQYRSLGDGRAPQVVTHTSGDCGSAANAGPQRSPSETPVAAPGHEDPHLVQAAYTTARR